MKTCTLAALALTVITAACANGSVTEAPRGGVISLFDRVVDFDRCTVDTNALAKAKNDYGENLEGLTERELAWIGSRVALDVYLMTCRGENGLPSSHANDNDWSRANALLTSAKLARLSPADEAQFLDLYKSPAVDLIIHLAPSGRPQHAQAYGTQSYDELIWLDDTPVDFTLEVRPAAPMRDFRFW